MKKLFALFAFALFLAPLALHATTPQAQEFDDLGMALYRQGLYAKAIPYFQNAVQADPNDWQGYENLGNAYFKINANADALSAYQKSLQLNPDNTTLENIVQSLQGNQTPVPVNNALNQSVVAPQPAQSTAPMSAAPAPPIAAGSVEKEQPIQTNPPPAQAPPTQMTQPGQQPDETIVIRHHRRYYQETAPTYADGLNPIDHAKFWAKFELGYNYSLQGDLNNSATAINAESANGSLFGVPTWSGNSTMSSSGYNLGGEFGFLLDPSNGIAVGFRYIQSNNYTFNGADSAAASIGSNPNDFENATFSPYVVPITLDYYLFLPDKDGRFFFSIGGGYYAAAVNVAENYNFDNYYDQTGVIGSPVGTLTGGNIGFEASIGREFAINRHFGLEIFARGRYARVSNIQGVLSDGNTYALVKYKDGTVDIDSPSNIGSNGETSATLDFTGFDIGASFNWYSF